MFHIAFTPDYSPSNALSAQHETLIGAIAELIKSLDIVFGPEEWYVEHVLLACHDAIKNMMEDKTAKASWTDMGCEDDAFSIDIFTHEEAKYVRHDGHKWLAPHGAVGFVTDPLHEQWLYDQAEIGDWENVLIPQAQAVENAGCDKCGVNDRNEGSNFCSHCGSLNTTMLIIDADVVQRIVDEDMAGITIHAKHDDTGIRLDAYSGEDELVASNRDEQPAIGNEQMKDIIANADHLQLMVVRRQYGEIYASLTNDEGLNVDIQSVMVVVDQLASSDPFFVRLAKDLAVA